MTAGLKIEQDEVFKCSKLIAENIVNQIESVIVVEESAMISNTEV